MVAPEPYHKACMEVLGWAILHARIMGWEGDVEAEKLADLMDAVHNIPYLVQEWEKCIVEILQDRLAAFQEKWGEPALATIFDRNVAGKKLGEK